MPPEDRTVRSAEVVRLVAWREITERVRDKSFAIGILSIAVVLALVLVVPRLLGFDDPDTYRVGWVDGPCCPESESLAQAAVAQAGPGAEVELEGFRDLATAEAALTDERVDAVIGGGEIVVDQRLDEGLGAVVQRASAQAEILEGFAEAGVPPDETAALLEPEPLPVRPLTPGSGQDPTGFAFIVVFVLYGQLFGYGFTVASGIVEEKATRVVEVLLSAVRPAQLLTGKILGIGVVGLLQLAATAVVGVGLVLATGAAELPPGALPAIGWALAWFVLGYALYACLFAVAGALVSRQEELQNVLTPLSFGILGALFFAFAALNDSGSVLARIGSFIPLTAPMVMPVRLTVGDVAVWETVLAVAIILASIVGVIGLAARAYTGGALQVGARVKLRQVLDSA